MNKIKAKILKKIKELERQRENIKEFEKKATEEESNKFEEDLKFINAMNPFYKKKHSFHKETTIMLTSVVMEAGIEKEINELKELLKGE
jgi:hypothetical protein